MSKATVAAAARRRERLQPIAANEIYSQPDFLERAGLSRHAFRAARKAGLEVLRAHTRNYISGQAWLDYLSQCGEASETTAAAGEGV